MTSSTPQSQSLLHAVEAACQRIPPLWPLQNFVAVNPFLGLSDMPFPEAAKLIDRVAHGSILMDASYYLKQLTNGEIQAADVTAALNGIGYGPLPANPAAWLAKNLQRDDRALQLHTVAGWLDQQHATAWEPFVVDEISKWASSYWDRAQSSWNMPWRELPLFDAWKRAASLDANPEVFGLPGFRHFVRQLPDSAADTIDYTLDILDVPGSLTVDFLHRQLMSVSGWSAYAAGLDRQEPILPFLPQVLAIRLAYDAALHLAHDGWHCHISQSRDTRGFTQAKYIAQLAAENAFRSRLAAKLKNTPAPTVRRPALQAVFCIDVRSEVYRRALESQSPEIATTGFAGFFGMALEFDSTARCPVLIAPSQRVDTATPPAIVSRRAASAWDKLRTSASACFSSVEVGGLLSGISILRQLVPAATPPAAPELHWNIPASERVALAAGAFKNMSLDPRALAKVVLLCGHGSQTANNPYGSSLDCGACGGHKGDVNARVAVALMTDPAVRDALQIPADTVFLAGLHNTTTDDVHVFGGHTPPELESWLVAASRQARRERNGAPPTAPEALDKQVRHRSRDWSEVRPEWGLAGNAAFIAAPRSRTKHLNLGGRAFLHDYNPDLDPDNAVLTLILTAPVVVASWINLQYYASTVNNRLFGSGNKVLHNVVGTFGVWEGNAGDLRTGLPLQSLHDGTKWMHEPLRLQVFIDAPRHRIDAVLAANPSLGALVNNGWIHVISLQEAAG